LSIDWREALYLGTRGGAVAMGLPAGVGSFTVGAPFDAQWIRIADQHSLEGVGQIDLFDQHPWNLSLEHIEKWWCLGDSRNREQVWVQGMEIYRKPAP